MIEGNKHALIVANSRYDDPRLRELLAPPQDAEALSEILANPAISGFKVQTLIDARSSTVCEEIEGFLEDREPDDLSLVYYSGHGIKDDAGLLFYAASNTQHRKLRSTGIPSTFVIEMMTQCRSKRRILLLDCCYSGAFARAKAGGSVNFGEHLAAGGADDGRGFFVLTASDAFQYSFEGEAVEGQGVYSVFTQALVQGLRTGKADLDGDGLITLDELYKYVQRHVKEKTPQQSPRRWEWNAEGSPIIALNPQPAEAELPEDLLHAIGNFMPEAREKAVARLEQLLRGKHRGFALAARNSLRALAEDDSRRVSMAAKKCLEAYGEERTAKFDERILRKPAGIEAKRKAEEDSTRKQAELKAKEKDEEVVRRRIEEEAKRKAKEQSALRPGYPICSCGKVIRQHREHWVDDEGKIGIYGASSAVGKMHWHEPTRTPTTVRPNRKP